MLKKSILDLPKMEPVLEILGDTAQPEQVMRCLIAIFDPGSPYTKDIQDHAERKRSAAQDFGVDDIESIVAFSNHEHVAAANWYLRYFVRSMDWAVIQANTETFWEYQQRLMTPIDLTNQAGIKNRDKDVMTAIAIKSKLAEDLSIIAERIEKHLRIFYGGDESLMKASTKVSFASSESIANVLKN